LHRKAGFGGHLATEASHFIFTSLPVFHLALGCGHSVGLAKNARDAITGFLPKLRPGMDRKQVERRTVEAIRDAITEVFGPPPK
jgi:hypothetical protein